MAKKEESVNMVEHFTEFKELKNIDRSTLISVLEDSFRSVLEKMFESDKNFDVIMNPDKGDCEIYQNLEVVPDGEVDNPVTQVGFTEAREIDPECELGDEVAKRLYFENFGRRAILNLRQILQTRVSDLQKEALVSKFRELTGEVVTGEVHQIWKKEMLLLDEEQNEMVMPKDEQIPSDYFHKGDIVRCVVKKVEERAGGQPRIIVSRTDNQFLLRLFEQEVPEIHDGLITIKAVARVPGERAKIAVESYDDRIDPVGACVGVKGSRIHGIVRELRNENIDVIGYTNNPQLFITRALSPARVSSIIVNEENRKADVFLRPEEVSLAIGKGGLNIKLATMLTGYNIDVYRDITNVDDIMLDEFKNEIDPWVIDVLKNLGLVTARQVLDAPKELIDQADLEDETVEFVMDVLAREFEDDNEEVDEEEYEEEESDNQTDNQEPTPEA